jgi:hypothetical protein
MKHLAASLVPSIAILAISGTATAGDVDDGAGRLENRFRLGVGISPPLLSGMLADSRCNGAGCLYLPLGGLSLRLGSQLDDHRAIYTQGSVIDWEGSLSIWTSVLYEYSPSDHWSLALGPAYGPVNYVTQIVYEMTTDGHQAGTVITDREPIDHAGAHFRLAWSPLVGGSQRRHAFSIAVDLIPFYGFGPSPSTTGAGMSGILSFNYEMF